MQRGVHMGLFRLVLFRISRESLIISFKLYVVYASYVGWTKTWREMEKRIGGNHPFLLKKVQSTEFLATRNFGSKKEIRHRDKGVCYGVR